VFFILLHGKIIFTTKLKTFEKIINSNNISTDKDNSKNNNKLELKNHSEISNIKKTFNQSSSSLIENPNAYFDKKENYDIKINELEKSSFKNKKIKGVNENIENKAINQNIENEKLQKITNKDNDKDKDIEINKKRDIDIKKDKLNNNYNLFNQDLIIKLKDLEKIVSKNLLKNKSKKEKIF
jgi:hypothetical protein